MPSAHASPELPAPPWEELRARLLEQADAMAAAGNTAGGQSLRDTVDRWWTAQQHWNDSLVNLLRVHHEINNALVAVSGNAQLLLRSDHGQLPGVKERLEVMLRESGRIEQATQRLREVKSFFHPRAERPFGKPRAA